MKNVVTLVLVLLQMTNAAAQYGDGPYPAWFGTTLPGVGPISSTPSAPSNSTPAGGAGGEVSTPKIGGKLGGYYYGGGGGPCEAGCDPKPAKPKPPQPASDTAQKLAAEKKQRRQAALDSYMKAAHLLFEGYGVYKTASSVEVAVNKVAFEWVGRLASSSIIAVYLMARDGGIGEEPLNEMLKQRSDDAEKRNQKLRSEAAKLKDELKEIKENDAKNLKPKKPAKDLPDNFRQPSFDPLASREEDVRRKFLKDKGLSEDQAKVEVKDFLRKNQGPLLGDLIATMLDVYDMDTVERDGLSEDAQAWLVKFNDFVKKANRDQLIARGANTCDIPSEKKFCNILSGKVGDSCYCNSTPGKYGVAASRPLGSICQTSEQFCEMPYPTPFGTGCFCGTASGAERGSIKW
jgi:hypothetical protein